MKVLRDCLLFFKRFGRDENGAIGVAMLILFPVVVGFATLSVDAPYLYETKNTLQVAADAAALAGDQFVGAYTGTTSTPCTGASPPTLCAYAVSLASANLPSSYATPLANADIVVGFWNNAGTFTPYVGATNTVPNAVQVTVRHTTATFLTAALSTIAKNAGFTSIGLSATATAAFTAANKGGAGSSVNTPSTLIVVQDISGSFQQQLANANAAVTQCAKDFAATGGAYSYFGLTLFNGNSPQAAVTQNTPAGGWAPQNWPTTDTGSWTSSPYLPLTAANSRNFLTNTEASINTALDNNAGGCTYMTGAQYNCASGTNQAAGMQAAINQICGSAGCSGGTAQIVFITDGIPNCVSFSGHTGDTTGKYWGSSTTTGQNCPAGPGNTGNAQLMTAAQTLATYAGSQGITVSTIYYSSNDNASQRATNAANLQTMTTNANAALKTKYGANYLAGQFFSEPTPADLPVDMQQICAGAANGDKPRLVL
jgi:hypothetical protein